VLGNTYLIIAIDNNRYPICPWSTAAPLQISSFRCRRKKSS
jgi:hypothetical protein